GPTLPITGVTLTEWDTGDNAATLLDDLGGTGSQGLALIVSSSANVSPTPGSGGGGGGGGSAAGWVIAGNPTPPQSGVQAGEQQSNDIGGTEIVRYSVQSGGQINIEQRNVQLDHVTVEADGSDGFPRFIPTYSFGDQN